MAVVAEETDEERRLREEQEAMVEMQQLLASRVAPPDPIQNQTPYGMIQDAPAAPPIPVAAELGRVLGPQIGSEQYEQELARAQRGNGYLAANVSPTGDVITGGYDPNSDPREIVARREAENLQRNQYISGLVRGGATYAEALRAGLGRYPNTVNPRLALQAEALALRSQPFTPRTVNVGGATLDEVSRGRFSRRPAIPPQKFVGGKASEATKIAADNIADQITALRRQLAPRSMGELPLPPEEAAAIKAEIAQKEKARVDLFNTPEANPRIDQVGWGQMRDRFNAAGRAPVPAAPAAEVEETITITTKEAFDKLPSGSVYTGKDGKKRRKP